jgi:carbamoyl-phosphate synthase large subunit
VLFTETLQKKFHQSPLPYVEGTNPPEVKVCCLCDIIGQC